MMKTLRNALQRLGWPTGELDDDRIIHELIQRWFVAGGDDVVLDRPDRGLAARAIYTTLAREGNLDALCWTTARPAVDEPAITAYVDAIIEGQQVKHDSADKDYLAANRRRSNREPRSELVDVIMDYGQRRSIGWLVDVSMEGAAFIMETENIPTLGARVESRIHRRDGEQRDLGAATIVRTEMLSHDLGLVCVELEAPVNDFTGAGEGVD